jgi:hypothetical protein
MHLEKNNTLAKLTKYVINLYLFIPMHSFISHYTMATFREFVYVAWGLILLNMNIYDENFFKRQCIRIERIHKFFKSPF